MTHTPKTIHVTVRGRVNGGAFTLVEAVMSMLIVGLMLVAALNTVGASRVSQTRNAEQSLGPMLADDLMAEILNRSYQEPVDTVNFGRESGESGGDRSDWDDVDDYGGWSVSPPQNKDGTDIPDLEGWGREVTVRWVKPTMLNVVGSNTGVKRIDVKVTHMGRVVTEFSALRTAGWPDP
jgi:type II secretory pathway pseudopilin PulG